MPNLNAIQVKNIKFRYDLRLDHHVLSDVSFVVEKGKWVSIIGENGSGKSTLARLLVGLLPPESGSIFINNQLVDEQSKGQIRKKLGIVFQNPDNQFIGTTVEDDVAFGLENQQLSYEEMHNRVAEALKVVDMYEHRAKDPSQLSGGQKQRVAIAGVLALQPEIMIFDESFVMLDPLSRRELLESLQLIQAQYDLTIISITHDRNEAALADKVIVLEQGKLISEGAPANIFAEEKKLTPPFAEALRRRLATAGVSIPNHYMSEEELVDWLCK
ncbi:energy-coupling factor transport system ATP-binding protein [Amphibacillus marinus]|uniref:Energy-coupling factor transport system ATP-binding protein n=1 Tax=Amphibacillus marinus TaxID=872970 RepID=A0A1H8TM54_9BACI|nr:energy-coupling factor transporter ATPase [Amphibacillus marinus]SEO91643.1 energy-coupling factor transport system ATP-binding protein [Amphibacillus marinus]